MQLENEIYLSEMSYINDASIDDINVESSEVTPLNFSLNEPSMNHSGTVRIEKNTEMKIPQPEIQRVRMNFTNISSTICPKKSS